MASIIEKRLKKLEKVIASIPDLIRKEAIKERSFIADLNRQQLLRGEKGDGTDMPQYVEGSKQPSAPGKITLFETGTNYASIETLFDENGFENVSDDPKSVFLINNYGKEIYDLNRESILKLRDKIFPSIKAKINEQIRAK